MGNKIIRIDGFFQIFKYNQGDKQDIVGHHIMDLNNERNTKNNLHILYNIYTYLFLNNLDFLPLFALYYPY